MSEPTDRPTAQPAPPRDDAGASPARPVTPPGLRPAAAEASPSAALAAAQASARERLERMRAQIAAASVLSRPADGAPRPGTQPSTPSAPARPADPSPRPAAAPTPAQQPQAAPGQGSPAEGGFQPAAAAPLYAEPEYAADDPDAAEDYDGAAAEPEPIEPAAASRPAKKTKLRGKGAKASKAQTKAPKEASRAATKLASLPGGVAPGREKAPPVEAKEPKIEWRSLLSTAMQWPWPSILTIYLRLNAALWFAMGLYYWARITGFVPWRMHYFWDMPLTWQSAIVLYAVLNLVTAVGLWLTAPWGPIVWVFTIVCQIVTHSALSDVFGERPFRIPFYVLSVFVYVILSIMARRSRR